VRQSGSDANAAFPHRNELSVIQKGIERLAIRPRQPSLTTETEQLGEQPRTPPRIEVRSYLIEEQNGRRTTSALRQKLGVREHEADQ